ncbi:MAG TPA: leucyl aminopeptidase [Acidimicrobiales bacterium]|nr:leucyl aminopeptidase [Acidimicrobiales bacterium]
MSPELHGTSSAPDADATARGVYEELRAADGGILDAGALQRRGFSGKLGEAVANDVEGRLQILVGLGLRAELGTEALRRAGAAAARAAASCLTLVIDLTGIDLEGVSPLAVAQATGEGALLASYRFERFRSEEEGPGLAQIALTGLDGAALAEGARRANAVARAVELCRDLVNTPAGSLTPRDFAATAGEVAAAAGLGIEVLEEEGIAGERLGGLAGVAAGSEAPARFVKLHYEPEGAPPFTVALVGKGITFDSGGLSLKPANSMMTMKTDMSGAAAVLGAMSACAALGVGVRVTGYLPITENMPGGAATKPGDVLTIRNGKTIEVLNTDAEGRLVLADALSLAVEDGADAIVDLATLTGACVVALGMEIAGVIGNDDRLISKVRAAAAAAGEALWPLPLPPAYRRHIDSEVADMKNIGTAGQAGALVAALLLEEFVGDVPWVHLDIAGPARSEEDDGYRRKGGTGFGVRTLITLLEGYEPLGGVVQGRAEGIEVLR